MTDCISATGMFLVLAVIAGVLLGWRDRLLYRWREARRPVNDRIDDVRKFAILEIRQVEECLEREKEDQNVRQVMICLIEYCRRLEYLATDPAASPDDAPKLAADSSEYICRNAVKGFLIDCEATRLAELLKMREDASS